MTNQKMLDVARNAVALAKAQGAQEASARLTRVRDTSLDWRDGKQERLSESTSLSLSVALYVDGRYSRVHTSDLRPQALPSFLENAVALTRALARDPFRALPPTELCGQSGGDLALSDAAYEGVTPKARRALAQQLEEAARTAAATLPLVSVNSGVWDGRQETWFVASNGFEGSFATTTFGLSAAVAVKDADGRRPSDGAYAYGRQRASLPGAQLVGQEAARRVAGKLGATKLSTRTATLVVENRAAGRLFSYLLGPLSGPALQQRQSFMVGKLGAPVGSKLLHLTDNPLLPGALASRPFDGEGLASRALPLFADGTLSSYYLDTYYAKKLEMKPTTGSASNLTWRLGSKEAKALIADVREGVYVTGFLGGNSNSTTGDFSVGVDGFCIRDGQLAEPISEMNAAGSHLTFWKQLAAVGSDPYAFSSLATPTLVFEGVSLAGA
jgi:PmbA protein